MASVPPARLRNLLLPHRQTFPDWDAVVRQLHRSGPGVLDALNMASFPSGRLAIATTTRLNRVRSTSGFLAIWAAGTGLLRTTGNQARTDSSDASGLGPAQMGTRPFCRWRFLEAPPFMLVTRVKRPNAGSMKEDPYFQGSTDRSIAIGPCCCGAPCRLFRFRIAGREGHSTRRGAAYQS